MREIVVYGCYLIGTLSVAVGIYVASDVDTISGLTLILASVFTFGFGFMCDKLAAIEALLRSETPAGNDLAPRSGDEAFLNRPEKNRKSEFSNLRTEDGQIVLSINGEELWFPTMEAAKNHLKGK